MIAQRLERQGEVEGDLKVLAWAIGRTLILPMETQKRRFVGEMGLFPEL